MTNQNTRVMIAVAAIVLIFGLAQRADAQLRDNESSSSYLALQIGASAGVSSNNYVEYAEKLAKTMSHLAPDQQATVFGFMPSPSGPVQASGGSSNTPPGSNTGSAPGGSPQIAIPPVQEPGASPQPDLSWWQDVLASIRGYFLAADDGNNGHGNDAGGVDSSNPGKSKGK